MVPAAQGFRACNFARVIIHLRLIEYLNLTGLNRRRQMSDYIRVPLSLFPLLRVIKLIAVLAGFPDALFRHPRKIQHMVYVYLLIVPLRQNINSVANLNPLLLTAVDKEIPHGMKDGFLIPPRFFISTHAAENDEMVSLNAPYGFHIRQRFHRFIGPKTQQFVSGFHAKAVVDKFEVLNIVVAYQVGNLRVGAQQFLRTFPKPFQAEYAGQRVMVNQIAHFLFMLQTEGAPFHHGNDNQRDKKKRPQEQNQPVFVEIIGQVIAVQAPGGMVQNHRLTEGVSQRGNAAVQTRNDSLTGRRVRRARPEVHGEHRRGLNRQTGIGGLLQDIAPHIGVM